MIEPDEKKSVIKWYKSPGRIAVVCFVALGLVVAFLNQRNSSEGFGGIFGGLGSLGLSLLFIAAAVGFTMLAARWVPWGVRLAAGIGLFVVAYAFAPRLGSISERPQWPGYLILLSTILTLSALYHVVSSRFFRQSEPIWKWTLGFFILGLVGIIFILMIMAQSY